jgi:hypothetical protein
MADVVARVAVAIRRLALWWWWPFIVPGVVVVSVISVGERPGRTRRGLEVHIAPKSSKLNVSPASCL